MVVVVVVSVREYVEMDVTLVGDKVVGDEVVGFGDVRVVLTDPVGLDVLVSMVVEVGVDVTSVGDGVIGDSEGIDVGLKVN